MVRVVIGYEGTGRGRRAVYRDDGPARAGTSGGMGGLSIATLPDPDRERDNVSAARREVYGKTPGWRDWPVSEQNQARPRATAIEAEPVTAVRIRSIEDVARHPALTAAISRALEEESVMEVAAPETTQDPTSEMAATVEPPCERCVHAPVCWIRRELDVHPIRITFTALPAGLSMDAWIGLAEVSCDFFAAVPAPAPVTEVPAWGNGLLVHGDPPSVVVPARNDVTRETDDDALLPTAVVAEEVELDDRQELMTRQVATLGAQEARAKPPLAEVATLKGYHPGVITPRQARTIDALRDHRGNIKSAADELQVPPSSVRTIVKALRDRAELPSDVARLLDRDEATA